MCFLYNLLSERHEKKERKEKTRGEEKNKVHWNKRPNKYHPPMDLIRNRKMKIELGRQFSYGK